MLLQLLIHGAGVANYVYGIYFQLLVVDIPDSLSKNRNRFGGAWKYLTFLNLWIQLAFHLAGLLTALLGSPSSRSRLRSARDFLFATSAFPIGIFVCFMFWGLFFLDRELVFPKRFDVHIPPFENHVLHTSVLVLQVLALCSTPHVYPPRRRSGMAVTAALCAGYLAWVFYIAYAGGFWVYPVLKVLSPPARAAFLGASCAVGAAFYLAGEALTKAIWGKHVAAVQGGKVAKD